MKKYLINKKNLKFSSKKFFSKKFVACFLVCILCVGMVFTFTACNKEKFSDNVLGTFLEVKVKGGNSEKIYNEIYKEFLNIEKKLSPTIESSDIFKFNNSNANENITVNQITIDLLKLAKIVNSKSGGAFNPATFSLVELWKFSPNTYNALDTNYIPPTEKQILETLSYSNNFDMVKIDEENKTISKTDQRVKIDLGGIAKGYCAELGFNILKNHGVEYGYINLGGNVYTYNKDIKIWLKDPRYKENINQNKNEMLGSFYLNNSSIATSGDYERSHTVNNIRYHHIINPKTGKPANSGVIACSVISNNGALADALATSVVILGLEKGEKLLREFGVSAIVITSDNKYKTFGNINFSYNNNLEKGYEKI